MPRGPKWNEDENEFLTGVLRAHGDKPRTWSEEVRNMVLARLAARTESGIYQQTLKLLKARSIDSVDTTNLSLATGA
jgi:hypothetical protein